VSGLYVAVRADENYIVIEAGDMGTEQFFWWARRYQGEGYTPQEVEIDPGSIIYPLPTTELLGESPLKTTRMGPESHLSEWGPMLFSAITDRLAGVWAYAKANPR
jgi:hypothetical protein